MREKGETVPAASAVAGVAVAAIEVSGLAGTLALLTPPALLLAAVAYAHRSVRSRKIAPAAAPATAALGVVTVLDLPPAEPLAKAPVADVEPVPVPVAVPVSVPIADVDTDWPARIERAEALGDDAALAEHYLAWARAEIAQGRAADAGEHLRTSVRIAAKGRHAALHAQARLELAELAREAGDLTTACEHWQLARALFHDLQEPARVGDTERLMQRHGCPTDWVLNDF